MLLCNNLDSSQTVWLIRVSFLMFFDRLKPICVAAFMSLGLSDANLCCSVKRKHFFKSLERLPSWGGMPYYTICLSPCVISKQVNLGNKNDILIHFYFMMMNAMDQDMKKDGRWTLFRTEASNYGGVGTSVFGKLKWKVKRTVLL